MVVAGVYMVARLYGVFFEGLSIGTSSVNLLAVVGGVTVIGNAASGPARLQRALARGAQALGDRGAARVVQPGALVEGLADLVGEFGFTDLPSRHTSRAERCGQCMRGPGAVGLTPPSEHPMACGGLRDVQFLRVTRAEDLRVDAAAAGSNTALRRCCSAQLVFIVGLIGLLIGASIEASGTRCGYFMGLPPSWPVCNSGECRGLVCPSICRWHSVPWWRRTFIRDSRGPCTRWNWPGLALVAASSVTMAINAHGFVDYSLYRFPLVDCLDGVARPRSTASHENLKRFGQIFTVVAAGNGLFGLCGGVPAAAARPKRPFPAATTVKIWPKRFKFSQGS